MTITISASGIALDGPLVAGEKVAVSVSGLSLAAEDKPTLALLARFPDALLASVELAEDAETPGTWTGELDTATKQTAFFFATARADERRDAALELVAGRVSLARLTVPMANSALCPKPDGSPFASPVYVPVPGPPGTGGDPYDQAPQMDGEASAGTADEYARGDHRHPTDATRQAVIEDLAAIRSGAAAGATAVQPAALSAYRTASAQDAIDGAQDTAIAAKYTKPASGIPASDLASAVQTALTNSRTPTAHASTHAANGTDPITPANIGAVSSDEFAPVEQVVSQFPSPSEILSLDAYNNVRKNGTELNAPPSIYGRSLALQEGIAPAFSSSSTYAVGDYVTHEGRLYKCTTAVTTAGAWDATKWTAVAVMSEAGGDTNVIESVQVNGVALTPDANKAVNIVKKVWAASATYSSSTGWTVTPEGSDFSLADGDVVFFIASDGATNNVKANVGGSGAINIVKVADSNTPNVTVGDWRTGEIVVLQYSGKKSKWVLLGAKKAPLASPAFTGTPTAPTAAAGTNTTQIATTAFVQTEARYALTAKTPSVSGTSATVACEDRAINDFTVATGITSLTITPPAAVTGRARDFFCRVTLTDSSLPTVTLSGGTIDIGASEVAGMTQGVNLLMFTEITSGHWLASRRSAS